MPDDLQFGSVTFGEGRPIVVIAEAACEHLGDLDKALRMVEAAKRAGADIVKFQLHLPEEMIPGSIRFWGGSMDEVLKRWNIGIGGQARLRAHSLEVGVQYLCTPFSAAAGAQLEEILVDGFKTGSGEMTNLPMLRSLARTGLPMIVSTGMATEDEIDETVEALLAEGAQFMLMNCTSAYPPRYDQLHLGYMKVLRDRYGVLVGHSDHTPEATSAIAAAALGAVAIEKHFTLDRATGGPDKNVSLEPAEFRAMVDAIRNVEQALGDEKLVTEDEAVVRAWAHHSVVAVQAVAEGATLTAEDVAVKRPGSGIPAKHLEEVVGRVAARAIAPDTPLQWEDLA